ncbi:hypothetical protein Tco_1503280 [Tanacetum coccineum]
MFGSYQRLIAQRMVDMLFRLERNEIRDVENKSRIKTLETNNANEAHTFRLEHHWQLQNLLPTIVAQVGDQGRNQGNGRNQNGDAINDNIRGDVRNVITDNNQRGCTYKEFLACNPKEYDGKGGPLRGGTLKSTHEVKKQCCGITPWSGLAMLCILIGMVAATEPKTIQKAVQLAGTLTDEALRNGSIKKNPEKRGIRGEPSKDRNVRDDNKRTRT